MVKAYEYEWNRLCIEYEELALKAWREASTKHQDGTVKSEREYFEELIDYCENLIEEEGIRWWA